MITTSTVASAENTDWRYAASWSGQVLGAQLAFTSGPGIQQGRYIRFNSNSMHLLSVGLHNGSLSSVHASGLHTSRSPLTFLFEPRSCFTRLRARHSTLVGLPKESNETQGPSGSSPLFAGIRRHAHGPGFTNNVKATRFIRL